MIFLKRGHIGCLFFSLGIILLSSCEEKIDWQLPDEYIETVVVEGILTNELKRQEIRLSRPMLTQNDPVIPISGAVIKVQTNDGFAFFEEVPWNPGVYRTESPEAASVDKTYELFVQYDGKEYRATTGMVPVIPALNPRWIYDPDKDLYSINWRSAQYAPNQQAMYEAVVTWNHLVDSTITDTLTSARILYYTFSTIDVSYQIFPQDREDVFFPRNSIAIVKKYSLTDDYAAFLRALLAETEWQGSIFEDARGNLPGNISNGGLGYFSACSVIIDTVLVK
jgi:hypothetical protein